jgi:ATP adenylyltransferase
LSKKPIDNRQQRLDSAPPHKPDPFENPPDALLIARVPVHDPTHALILNKFPVIPQHFIVATIPYKEQTQLLEVEDLQVTYACLKAWEVKTPGYGPARRLFAFFNSGEHSGASQSHRHVYIALFPLLSETRT